MVSPVTPAFLRPRAHRLALESRQLFDGAAFVEAAAAQAPDAPVDQGAPVADLPTHAPAGSEQQAAAFDVGVFSVAEATTTVTELQVSEPSPLNEPGADRADLGQ